MAPPLRWLMRLECDFKFRDFSKRIFCTIVKKEDEFRVLQIFPPPKKEEKKKAVVIREPFPPRTTKMPDNQDWTNVWPGPRTFHPATVPLPLLQGCNKHGPPPGKFANTELMKIPNFLHLTPPAIKKHCEVLKQFCTKWPEALKDEETIEKNFPVEVISSDYCHSSPSIRDPLSRIINLRVKLKNLELDSHAKDKFLRLIGDRYNPQTDYVTITTNSCPLKKQNYDYAHYLLTAAYFESWKFEDWEKEKSDDDMEMYNFSSRKSWRNVKERFDYAKSEVPGNVEAFGKAVENWLNEGDDPERIEAYKKEALDLMALPVFEE